VRARAIGSGGLEAGDSERPIRIPLFDRIVSRFRGGHCQVDSSAHGSCAAKRARTGRSVEIEFEHAIGRPRDDRAIALHCDRPLHQLRVGDQERGDRVGARIIPVVFGDESEVVERLVLADQCPGGRIELREDRVELLAPKRCFEIFDDVELDAALAQNLECAARLASARVVIDQQFFHRGILRVRASR